VAAILNNQVIRHLSMNSSAIILETEEILIKDKVIVDERTTAQSIGSTHPNLSLINAVGLGSDVLQNPKKYKGFMGISMGHKFFSKENMREYFKFFSEYFSDFVIVIMDDPDMHNFMIFKELSGPEALKKARNISDEIKVAYEKIKTGLKVSNIEIIQFRDFVNTVEYNAISDVIHQEFKDDKQFNKDIEYMVINTINGKIDEYVKEKSIKLGSNEYSEIIERLKLYALEEFIALVYFTKEDYLIEIDPHKEFQTKENLFNNHYPSLLNKLGLNLKRGHLDLQLIFSKY
jgi:hypothetical protein